MKSEQKQSLYNESGQVNDPDIAQVMANVEKPYREDQLHGLKHLFTNIKTGEELAEKIGVLLQKVDSHEQGTYGGENVLKEHVFKVDGDEIKISIEDRPKRSMADIPMEISFKINGQLVTGEGADYLEELFHPFLMLSVNEIELENIAEQKRKEHLQQPDEDVQNQIKKRREDEKRIIDKISR